MRKRSTDKNVLLKKRWLCGNALSNWPTRDMKCCSVRLQTQDEVQLGSCLEHVCTQFIDIHMVHAYIYIYIYRYIYIYIYTTRHAIEWATERLSDRGSDLASDRARDRARKARVELEFV